MYAQKRTEGSNPSLSATPVKKAASRGLLYGRGTNGGFEPEGCHANGLKKSFTGPDGISYAYTYDPNNQLNGIQLPVGSITINSNTWTAPAKITLPGGATRSHQYDPLMRLTNISAKDAYQNSLLSYQYAYDKAGNITQKNTEHGNYDYGYDNLYRLKTAANPSPLTSEAYGYDALGNRTTDSNLPGNLSYNDNNQLTGINGIAFDYDENGNTVKKTEGTTTTAYTYDTADRLTEVKDANNTIAKYAYDPFGRRLWKETNNQKTYFLYSDEGLIGEYDPSGAQTKAYGYAPDSTWTTDPLYLKQGTKYYFYQNDHLGTPQKLADSQGNVVWSARGRAFGTTTVDASSTVTNNLRFAGQYYDQETGLHYNWNRYYDPRIGRYITEDPIGLEGELNMYAYVENNPLADTDPLGLSRPGGGRRGTPVRPIYPSIGAEPSYTPIRITTGGPNSCGTCFEIYAVIPIRGTSRPGHRKSALRELEESLRTSQGLRDRLNKECGCDVTTQMRSGAGGGLVNPPGFELHHPVGMPGYVWLVRRCDHRDQLLRDFFHPGGIGGYADIYGR